MDSIPEPSSATLPPTHPISLKLRSILTTRTTKEEDEKTREALRALEDMYPRAASKKRAKDDAPTPFVDLDRARRSLETDARDQLLSSSSEFIAVLQSVDSALTQVQSQIASMSDACDDIDDRLTKSSNGTRYLLEQAQGLQRQQVTTDQQRAILDLFLSRFVLPAKEADTITNPATPVGSALFAAMDHLGQIRSDCRALLEGGAGVASGGTRAGMDIMSNTSELLDKAYEKIAKHLAFQFRIPPREGMDVGKTVRVCVARLLVSREDLLRPTLQILTSLRTTFHTTSFQQALSKGSSSSGSRPIELQAHDPIRYVGDMLAWIHQTVASEREFYGQLLSERDNEGGRKVGQRRRNIDGSVDWTRGTTSDDDVSRKQTYIRELLDRSLQGCCRPLSMRVEQTIRSQEGCITTFKLANLVQFYKVIMDHTIGSKAAISKMLGDLSTASYDAFFATLERHGEGLLRYIGPPDADNQIPTALESSTGVLNELLQVHSSSLSEVGVETAGPSLSTSIADFNTVVTQLVKPMMELVTAMEGALSKRNVKGSDPALVQRDALVFRINCVEYILNTISPYAFVASTSQSLRETIEAAKEQLVELDNTQILTQSTLSTFLSLVDTNAPTPTLIAQVSKFNTHLESPTLLTPVFLQNLHSPTLRSAIHQEALARVVRLYEGLWARVGEAVKREMRSPEEVALLFGV